jgi:hypothetical protein
MGGFGCSRGSEYGTNIYDVVGASMLARTLKMLDWVAAHASIATALIAAVALLVAWRSLLSQRDTARKRAALDFFLKTEMDTGMVKAFADFDDSIELLKKHENMPLKEFSEKYKAQYLNITHCLSIHELVAVGVYTSVLDKKVCYEYWADELRHARRDAQRVIEYVRTEDGGGTPYTFTELVKLADEWDECVRKIEANGKAN